MKRSLRNRIFLFISLMVLSLSLAAQQEYFVFIQSENGQPFYAKIGDKVHSASSIGHLVIPSLKDSIYSISVGFPKNQFPEIDFIVQINRKDHGYQLKNFTDQGWILFNLVSLQILKPKANRTASRQLIEVKKKTDGYSVLMAGIVNDTSVLYSTAANFTTEAPIVSTKSMVEVEAIRSTAKKSPDTLQEGTVTINRSDNIKDSVIVAATEPNKQIPLLISDTITKIPVVQTDSNSSVNANLSKSSDSIDTINIPANNRGATIQGLGPDILKIRELVIDSFYEIHFMVMEGGVKDTVQLIIVRDPIPSPVIQSSDTAFNKNVTTESKIPVPKDSATATKKLLMINSDCRNFASDHDVDKLRVKILAEKKVQDKIAAARKFYKTKCFTARQVRALSELFYLEQEKFDFLAASYPFVSDSQNYRLLESLLSDRLYVEKFRNLFPR